MRDWSRGKIVELLAECGRMALRHFEDPRARLKEDFTLVTEADREIEGFLGAEMDRPEHGSYLLGEETIGTRGEAYLQAALEGTAWIVDPIDGTAPFAHRIPTWGISVGLARSGCIEEGAVFLPTSGELLVSDGPRVYYGRMDVAAGSEDVDLVDVTELDRGGEALDERGIVAITQEMAKTGRVDLPNPVQTLATAVMPLAYLCLGRYEGYIGTLKLWDFAGALALLLKCRIPVKLLGLHYLDGRIAAGMCFLEPGHPRRWAALAPLVAARSRTIVERICAVAAGEEP